MPGWAAPSGWRSTADIVDAPTALEWGLVDWVVDAERVRGHGSPR